MSKLKSAAQSDAFSIIFALNFILRFSYSRLTHGGQTSVADPSPDPGHFGKLDPDPYQSAKLDPDPHEIEKQD